MAAIIEKRSPIPGLTNFGSAALTQVPRSHSIMCNRGSAMTPTRPSPRCSHHVKMRQAKCGSGGENVKRRRVSLAQPPREPALPMRRSPHGRTAIRGAVAAAALRARRRSFPEMRRSAPRIRAHLLPGMPTRFPACLLMQGEIFLPELPSEVGTRVWGLGRGERSCACSSPAIRLLPLNSLRSPPPGVRSGAKLT